MFLGAPLLVVIPLSFNAESFFTFTEGMLRLDPEAFSLKWYRELLQSERLWDALGRQLLFSFIILLIEIPLGILVALAMPKKGWTASLCLVLMALPLLIPYNVVGTIWQVFAREDIGLLGRVVTDLGIDYNYAQDAVDAWVTVIVMDVWHWTSLVALLAYAGLRSIPDSIYEAAECDRASKWRQFWTITIPMALPFLMLAVLFRGIENFKMFDLVVQLTGGGPGNTTTLTSIDLKREAFEKWRTGYSSAYAVILFVTVFGLASIYVKALNKVKER